MNAVDRLKSLAWIIISVKWITFGAQFFFFLFFFFLFFEGLKKEKKRKSWEHFPNHKPDDNKFVKLFCRNKRG